MRWHNRALEFRWNIVGICWNSPVALQTNGLGELCDAGAKHEVSSGSETECANEDVEEEKEDDDDDGLTSHVALTRSQLHQCPLPIILLVATAVISSGATRCKCSARSPLYFELIRAAARGACAVLVDKRVWKHVAVARRADYPRLCACGTPSFHNSHICPRNRVWRIVAGQRLSIG